MPQNATQSWPQTTDGVTDWETVFEDPEKGLIPLIAQAHTPQALRDCAVVTINMLFTRDSDAGDIAKLTAELHELAPDDADEARTGQIRGVISLLLRQIKEDRIESAREFLEKRNRRQKPPARRKPATVNRPPRPAPPYPAARPLQRPQPGPTAGRRANSVNRASNNAEPKPPRG